MLKGHNMSIMRYWRGKRLSQTSVILPTFEEMQCKEEEESVLHNLVDSNYYSSRVQTKYAAEATCVHCAELIF
jgi:hypothetical protein